MTTPAGRTPVEPARLDVVLDRSGPVPLYFQVAQQIETAIEDGTLVPGSRLPNELLLADQWSLSRPTVRRAIQHLVDQGLLVRKRGVGTQVVHGYVRRPLALTSLYDDLDRTNQSPTTTVLSFRLEPASGEVAGQLGIEEGERVYAMRRLRYARGEPLAILHNWLPERLARIAREDLERRGLYDILRSTGVHLRVAGQRMGAASADAAQAKLLGERAGAALLTMARTTFDDVGRAVEYGNHVYRAGHYFFEMTVVDR